MSNDINNLNGALSQLGETLATNISNKGVNASASDGLTTLANKINNISTGSDMFILKTNNDPGPLLEDETFDITAEVYNPRNGDLLSTDYNDVYVYRDDNLESSNPIGYSADRTDRHISPIGAGLVRYTLSSPYTINPSISASSITENVCFKDKDSSPIMSSKATIIKWIRYLVNMPEENPIQDLVGAFGWNHDDVANYADSHMGEIFSMYFPDDDLSIASYVSFVNTYHGDVTNFTVEYTLNTNDSESTVSHKEAWKILFLNQSTGNSEVWEPLYGNSWMNYYPEAHFKIRYTPNLVNVEYTYKNQYNGESTLYYVSNGSDIGVFPYREGMDLSDVTISDIKVYLK